MGNETVMLIVFTLISLAVGFAWVGGYLDAYQSKVQEKALDTMGENKASYGLKSILNMIHDPIKRNANSHFFQGTLKGQRVSGDKNINELHDGVADQAGGLVGKGGIGETIGAGLSKGL